MNDRFKAFPYDGLPDGIQINPGDGEWGPANIERLFNMADRYEGHDLVQILPAQAPDRKVAIFVYRRRDE